MRVYMRGVALTFAIFLIVLLLQQHFWSQRDAMDAIGDRRGRSRLALSHRANPQGQGSGKTPAARARALRAGEQGSGPAAAGRLSSRAAKAAAVRDASSGLGKQVINGQVARGQVFQTEDSDDLTTSTVEVIRYTLKEYLNIASKQLDIREVDPLSATEPMVIRQQEELEQQRFGFQPKRGRPKPPEKLTDESETWLKNMKFPRWYTDSVKRSKVYGKENDFVGGGPLFSGPCPGAEKVKAQYKLDNIQTFSYIEPGELLKESKNPCWYGDPINQRQLLCLPYFYVAGVAKCGTTDLYKRIRYHPEIMEGELKEYHWWDRLRYGAPMELKFTADSEKNESPLPLSEYSRIITGKGIEDLKMDLKTKKMSVKVCGDGSPSYLWDGSQWTVFEGNEGCTEPRIVSGSFIKHAYPPSKILLIFRHPTQRLYSRFLSRIPRYSPFRNATPQMFHDFVVKGVACYKKCFREHSIRECAYNETLYDEAVLRIVEGMYSVFVEDWFRIFTRDQIMVLRNEDYSDDVEGHIIDVFNFLNVATLRIGHMKHIISHWTLNVGQNYETVGPMLPETIQILNEFYKPFVLRLSELLGDERFLWKDIAVT